MVDAVRQIRHDLESLEKATLALGEEFDQVYDNYLTALRTSIQNQVVLACYHLCTQTHPQRFLDLSFRQREILQQAIQTCIRQCQQKLEHAYVLATGKWVEDEEEITTLHGSRRSLPSSEHRRRKRRGRPDRRPSNDDPSEQEGPSVEFIAITNLDGDEAIEASQDPFLAAALSEFAESLALDEDAIIKRVKQELLRKAAGAKSSKSSEGKRGIDAVLAALEGELENDEDSDDDPPIDDSASDAAPDGATDEAIDEANHPESNQAELSQDNDSHADTDQDMMAELEGQPSGEQEGQETVAATNSAPESASSDTVATALSPVADGTAEFPDNPDGKTFSDYGETLTPDVLASRQEQLEENLTGFLRDLSKQINHELHQVGMIPKKIPGAILRAALQTDMSSDLSGPPNVLNLLVEAEGKPKDSKVMRVTALRLRPAELEFSDPHLSACRSRIRELTGKLQKLGKQYHKKREEQAIAEAESAWRSSWYKLQD